MSTRIGLRAAAVAVGLLAWTLSAAACGDAQERPGATFDDDDAGSSSGQGPTSSGGGGGGSSGIGGIDPGDAGTGEDDCSDAARLVYLLGADNELYSFDPGTLAFTRIGVVNCPVEQANIPGLFGSVANSPNSMAVDRSGTAWVSYQNGELFHVSTSDASCVRTGFRYSGQAFHKYGMGFSSDGAGSHDETLYLSGMKRDEWAGTESGVGLFKLDTTTLTVSPVADYSGGQRQGMAELTGGGDGTLYGFFVGSPAVLATIDKGSAATSDVTQLSTVNLNTGSGYAFALSYWGGDFWFYHSVGSAPSKVSRLRRATDGSEEVVVQNVGGFRIVGAGVSTCAPTSPIN